jgi:hypothetical protein
MVFSGGSGAILEFLECLEGLGTKYKGSCEIWGFFCDFCGILVGLEWVRTYSYLFFKTEGPCCKFSKRTGTAVQCTTSLGGSM